MCCFTRNESTSQELFVYFTAEEFLRTEHYFFVLKTSFFLMAMPYPLQRTVPTSPNVSADRPTDIDKLLNERYGQNNIRQYLKKKNYYRVFHKSHIPLAKSLLAITIVSNYAFRKKSNEFRTRYVSIPAPLNVSKLV